MNLPHRSDLPAPEIAQLIKGFLASRYFRSLRQLHVEVDGSELHLIGQVRSWYEKQLALDACRQLASEYRLVDKIDVVPRSPDDSRG